VIAVGPRAHIENAGDRAEIEFAIEMGKQFVVARPLPPQRVAQRIGVDRDQEQAGVTEEVLSGGLRDLRRSPAEAPGISQGFLLVAGSCRPTVSA